MASKPPEVQRPPAIQPMQPEQPGGGKAALVAAAGTAAAALILSLIGPWEGKRNDPYKDIVGVMTVCYGETRVEMRRYSDAECEDMLAHASAGFSKGVLERNPELRNRPFQLAAAASLSYNIGLGNYRGSTVARRFSAHDWRGGCAAILRWNRAGGKVVKGLQNRRLAEYKVCMEDL